MYPTLFSILEQPLEQEQAAQGVENGGGTFLAIPQETQVCDVAGEIDKGNTTMKHQKSQGVEKEVNYVWSIFSLANIYFTLVTEQSCLFSASFQGKEKKVAC